MLSPHFRVTCEDGNGCVLHYRSKRKGYEQYVMGQLKESAKMYYDVKVLVKIIEDRPVKEGCHIVFRLDFDNSAFLVAQADKVHATDGTFKPITLPTFFKVSLLFVI